MITSGKNFSSIERYENRVLLTFIDKINPGEKLEVSIWVHSQNVWLQSHLTHLPPLNHHFVYQYLQSKSIALPFMG